MCNSAFSMIVKWTQDGMLVVGSVPWSRRSEIPHYDVHSVRSGRRNHAGGDCYLHRASAQSTP